jgi:hypothetical protein
VAGAGCEGAGNNDCRFYAPPGEFGGVVVGRLDLRAVAARRFAHLGLNCMAPIGEGLRGEGPEPGSGTSDDDDLRAHGSRSPRRTFSGLSGALSPDGSASKWPLRWRR